MSSRNTAGFGEARSLSRFNPGLRAVTDEVDEQIGRNVGRSVRSNVIAEVIARRTKAGMFDSAARRQRLVTVHNKNASAPVSIDVFNGPFDEHYRPNDDATCPAVFTGSEVVTLLR